MTSTTLRLIAQATPVNGNGLPGAQVNGGNASPAELQIILGIFFGIVGAMAVMVIVISGISYMTSTGDPAKAARAKNAIIYALVGVAVAVAAEGIVAFVVGKL